MERIFKYQLVERHSQNISIPEGAQFLSVLEQDDHPVVYFLVDPSRREVSLEIRLLGTGHPIEDNYLQDFLYLGTVSTLLGSLIWHLFAKRSMAWGVQ